MSLKNKYEIDDATWQKLWNLFKVQLVLYPLSFGVVAGFSWAILDSLTWVPAIAILWFVPYLLIILFCRTWLIRSKFTVLTMFLVVLLFELFFLITSSAAVYRFFGMPGFCLQNLLLLVAGIYLCRYYYTHWDKVWESHKAYNETVVLDLENARHDFLKNFDWSEDIVKKSNKKGLSSPTLMNIAFAVAPIGPLIYFIFFKDGERTIPTIIMWGFSIPFVLGGLKIVMLSLYMFRKLAYYEKKIGKPIINGLLQPLAARGHDSTSKNS